MKHIELFKTGFDDTINEKRKYKNRWYVAHDIVSSEIVYTELPNWITFTAEQPNSSVGLLKLSTNQTMWYSTDIITWNNMNTTNNITLTNVGDKLYVRGILNGDNTIEDFTQFKMSGKISISGNINAVWNYTNLDARLKEYCGRSMFSDCSSLINTPEFPAKILSTGCYRGMFARCKSLTSMPKLLAKFLANECYSAMFKECTSLTNVYELPATTLTNDCYNSMFYGCTSLTTAPELPATILTGWCYSNMFVNCTSLNTAPELPATTLAEWCYHNMFYGCASLVTPPELPATKLAYYCYCQMFGNCTRLTEAPELSAMTLAEGCYYGMFVNCSSLTTAPDLPALILAKNCYHSMFYNCSGLITSMEILPATDLLETNWTLAGFGNGSSNYSDINDSRATCDAPYQAMFAFCTSLTTAPILPAKQLSPGCYGAMFHSCKKLTKVIILAETLRVNISDENFNTVVELAKDYNGQVDRNWMELNAAVCWIDHTGNITTRKFYVPESAINDWNSQTTYFTHVFADNMEIISQEEIDNIIERYNIVY